MREIACSVLSTMKFGSSGGGAILSLNGIVDLIYFTILGRSIGGTIFLIIFRASASEIVLYSC